MDQQQKVLSPEKIELLNIIGEEIINRLKTFKVIESLQNKVAETQNTQKKIVHDIRGPIGGIIGLAQIISEQGKDNKIEEVLEFINLIHKSGNSILELADEILTSESGNKKAVSGHQLNLEIFKEKLEKLYLPQAKSKNVNLTIVTSLKTEQIAFSKSKLVQIAGNLISNAIKFTPEEGDVVVNLALEIMTPVNILKIQVKDSGRGLNPEEVNAILEGNNTSKQGTSGEHGYGFGLALVQHLVKGLGGTFTINSKVGEGSSFEISLPQDR